MIHASAIVDPGAIVGERTRIWHFSHVMSGAVIGADCVVGQGCFVASGVRIGDRVRVQNNVSLYDGVELADEVFVGPSAVFTNVVNPRAAVSRKHAFRPTRVARGATVGANATLVCGVSIGEYAFIAAGAVVRRDVGAFELTAGVPARRVGWMSRHGARLEPDAEGVAVCPDTGERYRLQGGVMERVA